MFTTEVSETRRGFFLCFLVFFVANDLSFSFAKISAY